MTNDRYLTEPEMDQLISELHTAATNYKARCKQKLKGYTVRVDNVFIRRSTLKGLRKVLGNCLINLSKVKVFINYYQEGVVDLDAV